MKESIWEIKPMMWS